MSTYTKKHGLSSKEKKIFTVKPEYTLLEIWEDMKITLMRQFLYRFGMEFDYGTSKLREKIIQLEKKVKYLSESDKNIDSFLSTFPKKEGGNNQRVVKSSQLDLSKDLLAKYKQELSDKKTEKLQILEAEVFWRFILTYYYNGNDFYLRRINIGDKDKGKFLISELACASWTKLYSFIKEVRDTTDNAYLKVSCSVLSLPESVWKELLWRKNIDFQSYESFLRRLKPDQIEAIYSATDELFEEKRVPSIFKKDKIIRRLIKKIPSFDELMEETTSHSEKYSSKGAMSYDLFNLDFGYGRYPNGVEDDKEETEKDISRFISIKNHVNDFIVNKRDGMYWWLYKKARSNYVYRPNREVSLSTHICPGFWYTLIMHLIFWVISPLAYVSLVNNYSEPEFSFAFVSLALFGSFTSVWLILAALKWSGIQLFILLSKIVDYLDDAILHIPDSTKSKISGTIGICFDYLANVAKLTLMITLISCVFLFAVSLEILLGAGLVSISGLYKGSIMYLVANYLIYYISKSKIEKKYIPNFKYWPATLKFFMFAIPMYILGDIIEYYSQEILHFFVLLSPLWAVIALGFSSYLLSWKLTEDFDSEKPKPRVWDKYTWKHFKYVSYLIYTLVILFWLTVFTYSLYTITPVFLASMIAVMLVPFIFIGLMIFFMDRLLILSPDAKKIKKNLGFDVAGDGVFKVKRDILQNKYIISMSDQVQKRFDAKIIEIARYITSRYSGVPYFLIKEKAYKTIDSRKKLQTLFYTYRHVANMFTTDDEMNKMLVNKLFVLISQDYTKKELLEIITRELELKKLNYKKEPESTSWFKKTFKLLSKELDVFVSDILPSYWKKFVGLKSVKFTFALSILIYISGKLIITWFITSLVDSVLYIPRIVIKYARQFWSTYKIFMNACPHVAEQEPIY